MRASHIIRRQLRERFGFVHAKRVQAIFRAVEGLLRGGRLSLTAVGRHLPGEASEKHLIKAADRLLGSHGVQLALPRLYRAFAHWLLHGIPRPVLLVDVAVLNAKTSELRAALALEGRALPVYSEVLPAGYEQDTLLHREFLEHLAAVIPPGCRPILVTDAGFHFRWFDAVRKRGWDFVARLRNSTKVFIGNEWVANKSLHARATRCHQDLGNVLVGKSNSRTWRLVLSKQPASQHRTRKTTRGTPGQRWEDKARAQSAHEPWLLATTITREAASIVSLYATRMQVEESFRDSKSQRLGWALSDSRSKTSRIAVLLFLAALATALVHAIGAAAEQLELHRRFQANTTTKRRVLSLFFLGRRVLQTTTHLSYDVIDHAFQLLRSSAQHWAPAAPS